MAKYLFTNYSTGQIFVPGTNSYPVKYGDILVPGPSNQVCIPANQSADGSNPPAQFPANGNRIAINGYRVGIAGLSGARNYRPDGSGSFVPYLQYVTLALVNSAGVIIPNTTRLIQFINLNTWTPLSLILQAPASAGVCRLAIVQNNLNQADPLGFGNFEFDSLNIQAIYGGELIARQIDLEVNTVELLGA